MKQLIVIITLFILSFDSNATTPTLPTTTSAAIINDPTPTKREQYRIAQMKWFTSLAVSDYEKLHGKKLNSASRFAFKLSQKRMKKMLKQYANGDVSTSDKIAWFGKGLILGPIAVLLAYIFFRDEDRELIKWTWFGFATLVVIAGVILLTL